MDIIVWDQKSIRKKAIESCIAMVIFFGLQLTAAFLDRTTNGYINLFVCWPLIVFASIQAISVTIYYVKHFKSARVVFLLLTLPVYAFWVYFLGTMIATY